MKEYVKGRRNKDTWKFEKTIWSVYGHIVSNVLNDVPNLIKS